MDDKMKEKKMRRLILTFLWCAAVILAIVFSMRLGSSDLSLKEFFSGFMKKEGYEKISFILWNLRFPRTLSGILAGIGLSVSGLALQNITGNDLAGPNIIGVNAGAGFFVIMGMYFFSPSIHVLPVFAFFGAFMATVVIVLIGGAVYEIRSAIILAGVAVTALLNAGISLISLLDTDILSAYNDFSVGGLAHSDAGELAVPAVMICVSVLVMMYYAKDIDTMMLGDEIAKSLGVNIRFVRFAVIMVASIAAGAVVSFAGLLGFVGLVVPHMSKKLFGIRTKQALPGTVLIGATVVLFADTVGRTAFKGTEVPVGIVLAFVGVPFFLYLIFRRRTA